MRQNESPDNIIPVSGGMQTTGQVVQYAEEPQQEVAGARIVDAAGVQADVNALAVDSAGVQAGVNALAMDAAGVQADVNALAVDAADAQVADGAETDASRIADVQPADAGSSGRDEEQNAQTGDEPEYMIDAEGLVKIYKTKETEVLALSGLDLKIQKGEFTALIGNSGSGKSTFLNMIGGLDVPSAGKLYVGGKNLFRMTERERVRYKRDTVGFVWQNNARNLFPYLTAIDNVCIPMRISGLRHKKQKAEHLLELVGMINHRNDRLGTLSGGEQQRIAIAIALANSPGLLLADEPTGSVDERTGDQIFEIFTKLNESGQTILVVTHDLALSRKVRRVVAIRDGRISSERILKESFADRLKESGVDWRNEETQEEYVVVDKAGRLQLPADMIEKLGGSVGRLVVTYEDGQIRLKNPASDPKK